MTVNEDEGGHWGHSRSSHDRYEGKGKRADKLIASQMAIKSSAVTRPSSQKWATTKLAVEALSVTCDRAPNIELRLYVLGFSLFLSSLITHIFRLVRRLDILIESRYHLPALGV